MIEKSASVGQNAVQASCFVDMENGPKGEHAEIYKAVLPALVLQYSTYLIRGSARSWLWAADPFEAEHTSRAHAFRPFISCSNSCRVRTSTH